MDEYQKLIRKIKEKGVYTNIKHEELSFVDSKIKEIASISKEIEDYIADKHGENMGVSTLNAVLFQYPEKDLELSRVNFIGNHDAKEALVNRLLRSSETRQEFLTPYACHLIRSFGGKVNVSPLLDSIADTLDDITEEDASYIVITALDKKLALISTNSKEEIKDIFRELLKTDNLIRQIIFELVLERNAEKMARKNTNEIKN